MVAPSETYALAGTRVAMAAYVVHPGVPLMAEEIVDALFCTCVDIVHSEVAVVADKIDAVYSGVSVSTAVGIGAGDVADAAAGAALSYIPVVPALLTASEEVVGTEDSMPWFRGLRRGGVRLNMWCANKTTTVK